MPVESLLEPGRGRRQARKKPPVCKSDLDGGAAMRWAAGRLGIGQLGGDDAGDLGAHFLRGLPLIFLAGAGGAEL